VSGTCSALSLLLCSTAARRSRLSLATSCCAPPPSVDPSPSAALAPLFWPPARLPRLSSLLPELTLSDSSPPPWQMPALPSFPSPTYSYRELLWFKPFPFRSFFPLPCTHRTPNAAASSLNSGALLLAVGSPFLYTPHHYNPLESFSSPH
jgi:hypothetical protein